MSVRFLCTSCNTSIKAKDEYSGKTVRCPHCRERTIVPPDDQPNDVLEIGDAYGLAAISVGEIEIDSPEMHIGQPKRKNPPVRLPATQLSDHSELNGERSPSPVTPHGPFPLLLRASSGLRFATLCSGLVWLYILGGELIEFAIGRGSEAEPANQALQDPLLHLSITFIAGVTIVSLLAGASDGLRVLLDIRNSLSRTRRD